MKHMKYIRTEDGVYPNEYPYQIDKRECLYEITCRIPFSTIEHGKVIKQADTIEELVEEYYYASYLHEEYPYTPRRCIKIDNVWRDYDNFGRLGETEIKSIKAGIWTDKGLIYVAKMNDKGELELL